MTILTKTIFPNTGTLISGLLDDYYWADQQAGVTQVTYSFPSGSNTVWSSSYGNEVDYWSQLSSGERQQVNAAVTLWESIANIRFEEVNDSTRSVGDIRFAHSDVVSWDGLTVAWAYLPGPFYINGTEASDFSGDIWLNNDDYSTEVGSFEFLTLVHEIGHALGLAHPHDGWDIMPSFYDNTQYTIMSYNDHADTLVNGQYPSSPMVLDITAIQYIYGANTDYNSGDTQYQFETDGEILTIWDGGGSDTFDFSNQQFGIDVSLVAGSYSSVGYLNNADQLASNNLAIAYNVVIENVIGSKYADIIVGNSADNIFVGGLGDDTLLGGAGGDVLVLDVAYIDASILFFLDGVTVSSSQGLDSLNSIEAIEFSDGYVSLLSQDLSFRAVDMVETGRIVSLYQAALNREPDVAGINFWIDSYSQGIDLLDIAESFVNSSEFSTQFSISSNADYIDTLYHNVLGRAGEESGVLFWLEGLDNNETSYAEILLGFSDSVENQNQVLPLLESLNYQASNDWWLFG